MNSFQTPPRLQYTHISQSAIQREGDWICYICHNLNFSFRKKCNRCKNMTREQNQQYLIYCQMNQHQYQSQNQFQQAAYQEYSNFNDQPFQKQYQNLSVLSEKNSFNPENQASPEKHTSTSMQRLEPILADYAVFNWDSFLNKDDGQLWESTCSDSSGQHAQQLQMLEYEIQQMVTRIII